MEIEKLSEYCELLGFEQPFIERVNVVKEICDLICPDPIMSIFINNFLKDDGQIKYDNIFFFSDMCLMEAKEFISSEDCDILLLKPKYLQISSKKFDFKNATTNSSMKVILRFSDASYAELRAQGENCNNLLKIVSECIKPNMR